MGTLTDSDVDGAAAVARMFLYITLNTNKKYMSERNTLCIASYQSNLCTGTSMFISISHIKCAIFAFKHTALHSIQYIIK